VYLVLVCVVVVVLCVVVAGWCIGEAAQHLIAIAVDVEGTTLLLQAHHTYIHKDRGVSQPPHVDPCPALMA
jgi:hypothetical protein